MTHGYSQSVSLFRNGIITIIGNIFLIILDYSCSHVAARLKGEFRHIAGIGTSCTLHQMVYSVLPQLACMKPCCQRFPCSFCVGRRWIAVLLQVEHCYLLIFSSLQGHRQTDQISTRGLHKSIPRNWQIQITQKSTLHCSYQQESDNPQTWKCWITSTMAWRWKTNFES